MSSDQRFQRPSVAGGCVGVSVRKSLFLFWSARPPAGIEPMTFAFLLTSLQRCGLTPRVP
eukprot:6897319-Prymnesium_polylepis.1